jgi:two-component system sensor histidine kinase MprB
MTLRARIALALALLAGLAALLVGVVTYVAIGQRVRAEVDRTLDAESDALRGPDDLRVLNQWCQTGSTPVRPGGRELEGFERFGGVVVQCLDPDGEIVYSSSLELPVSDTDRALAAGEADRPQTRSVTVDDVTYRVETVPVNSSVVGAVQFARDYTESQRVLDALRWLILAVVVAVAGMGALAGWLVARRATRPLVQLTDAAEQVAATGSLEVALPDGGNDEPGRLSRAFATMLAALGQSRTQQQQLVQDAGHELRTPLTSLRTNVETLQRHPDLPGPTRDAILTDLDTETRELGSLVDELVQLATDTYADEPEQVVALDSLVERAAARVRRRTGRTVVVRDEPCVVVGRPRDLARAVGNLIDNAAKFSEAPSPVEVSVAHGVVEVRDHGPGVAEADQPHVFQRFYRAASARPTPGSGLGLSIVEQTARTHGGTVSVTNHPGGGAVFTLSLPEVPPPPPPPPGPAGQAAQAPER